MFSKTLRNLLVIPIFLVILYQSGCKKQEQKQAETVAPDVIVDKSFTQDVQLYIRTQGYTEASQSVSIPARVVGFLQEIKFKPGDLVKEGQPLFTIEPDDYSATLSSYEAQLKIDEAKELLAKANLGRSKGMFNEKTISLEEYQTTEAAYMEAIGNKDRTIAAIVRAKLNLDYTTILSPIEGKTGTNFVDQGNLVGPGSSKIDLVTINKMDPIFVYFQITDYDFNKFKEKAEAKNGGNGNKLDSESLSPEGRGISKTFDISLLSINDNDGESDVFPYEGTISLTDNTISDEGVIMLRGEIPNPDYRIFPNQICRVRIPTEMLPNSVLVRVEAINYDLNSKFILIVDKDNIVRRRNIKVGELIDKKYYIVEAGLKPDETYIYQGIQRAKINSEVVPFSKEDYDKKHNLIIENGKKPELPGEPVESTEPIETPELPKPEDDSL